MDDLVYNIMYHIKSVQQYLTSELTLTLNWISMFNEDFSTVTIFKGLINHKRTEW